MTGDTHDKHEFRPLLAEIEDQPLNPLGRTIFWIIITALLCALVLSVSIGAFAVFANNNDNGAAADEPRESESGVCGECGRPYGVFRDFKDGEPPELPEGFEFPERRGYVVGFTTTLFLHDRIALLLCEPAVHIGDQIT